jgi:hypothetical protein
LSDRLDHTCTPVLWGSMVTAELIAGVVGWWAGGTLDTGLAVVAVANLLLGVLTLLLAIHVYSDN